MKKIKPIQEMKPIYDAVWTGRIETEWVKVQFLQCTILSMLLFKLVKVEKY